MDAQVLLIEDNDVNQEVMGNMLTQLGVRVRIVDSGPAGLKALQQERFDLILLDIQMPGMDGITVLEYFRLFGPKAMTPGNTPVIAVTANALAGDRERFLDLGFDDYLPKPFRIEQLQKQLEHYLGRGKADCADGVSTHKTHTDPGDLNAILDPHALEQLRSLDPDGRGQVVERVIAAFRNSLERFGTEIDEALSVRFADAAAMRLITHSLKSSATSVGATQLAELARNGEAAWRLLELAAPGSLPTDNAVSLLRELRQEMRRLAQALTPSENPDQATPNYSI